MEKCVKNLRLEDIYFAVISGFQKLAKISVQTHEPRQRLRERFILENGRSATIPFKQQATCGYLGMTMNSMVKISSSEVKIRYHMHRSSSSITLSHRRWNLMFSQSICLREFGLLPPLISTKINAVRPSWSSTSPIARSSRPLLPAPAASSSRPTTTPGSFQRRRRRQKFPQRWLPAKPATLAWLSDKTSHSAWRHLRICARKVSSSRDRGSLSCIVLPTSIRISNGC